jgi:DNA-binding XRE family transcriptional regulator
VEQKNDVKHLRSRKGITQEKLAQLSGLSVATIFKIEKGGRATLRTAYKLCIALETDLEHLEITIL